MNAAGASGTGVPAVVPSVVQESVQATKEMIQDMKVPTQNMKDPVRDVKEGTAEATKVVAKDEKSAGVLLECDGSLLEGGGQVLRNCTAYAALLNRGIHVTKIRAGRGDSGGIGPQHYTGLLLILEIFGGVLQAELKATEMKFCPSTTEAAMAAFQKRVKTLRADPSEPPVHWLDFEAKSGTAGSTGLLLQISIPTVLFLPYNTRVVVRGGTDVMKAPVVDYTLSVFLPMLRRLFSLPPQAIELVLKQRGFYPKGGGCVELWTRPMSEPLPAFSLVSRGVVTRVHGLALVSGRVPQSVADRMVIAAQARLQRAFQAGECGQAATDNVVFSIVAKRESPTVSPFDGVSVFLWAETDTQCRFGGSAIGKKGVTAEQVGQSAADELIAGLSHGGCADEYLSDQLIIFMALARGTTRFRVGPLSLHTKTAIHWATELGGAKFKVTPYSEWFDKQNEQQRLQVPNFPAPNKNDLTFMIECDGIAYSSRFSVSKRLVDEKCPAK